ncbi:hypothetical protein NSERUTF1_7409 [Nocardia seriolae]|nr:hypothetical protein NSERUTF1_7409 [Nocardia seriolae]
MPTPASPVSTAPTKSSPVSADLIDSSSLSRSTIGQFRAMAQL